MPVCIRAHRHRLGFAPGMMRAMAFPETKKPRQDRGFCLDGGEAAGYRKVPTRPRRVLLRDNAAIQTQALHIVPGTDAQVCTRRLACNVLDLADGTRAGGFRRGAADSKGQRTGRNSNRKLESNLHAMTPLVALLGHPKPSAGVWHIQISCRQRQRLGTWNDYRP